MTAHHPTDWLRAGAEKAPGTVALQYRDRAVPYAELAELASRSAAAVSGMLDVGPGGVLGVGFGEPRLDLLAAMWGTWSLGGVVLPLDLDRRDSDDVARAAGAATVITGLEADGVVGAQPDVRPDAASPHTLIRTSGTGGEPRLAVLTHGNVAAAVAASGQRLGNGPGDRWLAVLPLFHVGGLSVLWRSAAAVGTAVVHEHFEPQRVAGALRSGEVTIASMVPTMLDRVLEAHEGPYDDQPTVLLGGASAPRSLVERGLDAGLQVLTTYGLTEACSQVATVVPGEQRESLGTVGLPLPGVSVSIVDDEGRELPAGERGRIAVAGPTVSPGYVGETEPEVSPGYLGESNRTLVTSDLGWRDDRGRLVVVGRADDVIVTGGENVHPAEVEAALASHPSVAEAAVFAIPDDEWGQSVGAAVVLTKGAASDNAALADHAKHVLPPHAVPRHWRFVDALPRTPLGKLHRAALIHIPHLDGGGQA